MWKEKEEDFSRERERTLKGIENPVKNLVNDFTLYKIKSKFVLLNKIINFRTPKKLSLFIKSGADEREFPTCSD